MPATPGQWNESPNASKPLVGDKSNMFRRLFEQSHDPTWLLDPSSEKFIDCNRAAVSLMRAASREQVLALGPADLSPETQEDGRSSRERTTFHVREAMATGSARFDWLARRLDGTVVPLEVGITAVEDGLRCLLVVVARDVTERRRAEAALKEHRQLLASVTDNIREAVYRSSPDHVLTFVNTSWLRLFGFETLGEARSYYPRERLYARPEERLRLLERLQSEGGFTDEVVEFVRRDGSRFWGSISCCAVRESPDAMVAYHVGSIIDVTERRRVDAELRASEARFRRLFEDSADAMALIDPIGGRFIDVNQSLLFKLGFERKGQLVGVSAGAMAPEVQPDGTVSTAGAEAIIRRALREGSIRTEWWVIRSDGTRMPIDAVITAIQVGERPLLLSVARDISERKRAEASLKQLNARLEDLVAERTAALQVSNQLLRDEIVERQRREKVEHALFRITEAIHQSSDVGQLYPLLHEAVGELMPARNFFIALHDAATGLHHFVYHRDEMDPAPKPRRLGQGLTAHVFRTGKSLLLNRASMVGGVELNGTIWKVENGTPSAVWLGAPLVVRGRILGVMAVQDYHDERAFGEDEKRLLTFIAEQAGLAIERKRAEQALRESEERHRALFEGSSQGVMLHDENEIIAVNSAVVRMHGYTCAEDMVGKHPRDTSAPFQPGGEPSGELAARHIAAAFEHGQTRFEWLARTRDGRDFPIEVLLTVIQWGSRKIIQAVLHDISARRRREHLERALFRISESIHEAGDLKQLYPMIHRIVGELMSAENFFIALLNPSDGMLEFPYWQDRKDPPPPPRPAPRGLTALVLKQGRSVLVTAEDFAAATPVEGGRYFGRLGVTVPVGSGTQPLVWLGVPLNLQGRTIGAMVLQHYEDPEAYDQEAMRILGFIAEQAALAIGRKRAELELRRALEREKELGRMKSSFTSLVSHEFRTPLGVIASSAEILRDYFDRLDPSERLDHLETITKHTRRMGAMMEEVLLLSRFDAGKTEFRAESLDLRVLADRIGDEVLSATQRRCPVEVRIPEPLPHAVADERLLRHIITNLLVNASKYSEPGSPVDLTVRRDAGDAVFEIRDRGIGIPESDRQWMFQAFHRGSNVGTRPGTGLGLVIVKRCIDLHRGQIEVESEVGHGTLVRVRVPAFVEPPPSNSIVVTHPDS